MEIINYFFRRDTRVKEISHSYDRLPYAHRGPGWIYCTKAMTEFAADNWIWFHSWHPKTAVRFFKWMVIGMNYRYKINCFEKDKIK